MITDKQCRQRTLAKAKAQKNPNLLRYGFNDFKKLTGYTTVGLLINPNINEITAITNNTWIKPVAEYINTPRAHPMIRITATIYNNEFMADFF